MKPGAAEWWAAGSRVLRLLAGGWLMGSSIAGQYGGASLALGLLGLVSAASVLVPGMEASRRANAELRRCFYGYGGDDTPRCPAAPTWSYSYTEPPRSRLMRWLLSPAVVATSCDEHQMVVAGALAQLLVAGIEVPPGGTHVSVYSWSTR